MRPKVEYTLEAFANAEYGCHEAFKEHQEAQDNLDILREHSKDYLAQLMTDLDDGSKISETKLERLARSSYKWKEFRKGVDEATRQAGIAKVRYYSYIRHFDCIQSGLSYRKEELKKLGT